MTPVLTVTGREALAQRDARTDAISSGTRHQVSGFDGIIGTYKLRLHEVDSDLLNADRPENPGEQCPRALLPRC